MKRLISLVIRSCFLFAGSTCFAQMYTVNDLGTLGGSWSQATGINNHGQVIGSSGSIDGAVYPHGFRTAPNRPINPATINGPGDDIGGTQAYFKNSVTPWGLDWTVPGPDYFSDVEPYGINDSGQVVGIEDQSYWEGGQDHWAFLTPSNSTLVSLGDAGDFSAAIGINASGLAVGTFQGIEALRFDSSDDFAGYDLGTLGGLVYSDSENVAYSINDSGQVVGSARTINNEVHAFRTAPNSLINPSTDDLGTLNGGYSVAFHINAFGQAVGTSDGHAFRTRPNAAINTSTDDLGPGSASAIDDYGQVVGTAGLYSNSVWHDLNKLISPGSNCVLVGTWVGEPWGESLSRAAIDINDAGQIATTGNCNGQEHAVRLDPIYKAFVQPPIKTDGSSVFNAHRGDVPVKFVVTQYGTQRSCSLPATISVTRATAETLAVVDESTYSNPADEGSNLRIDRGACQYIYNLSASSLGVGTYRVDISINGIMVGHAVFALK